MRSRANGGSAMTAAACALHTQPGQDEDNNRFVTDRGKGRKRHIKPPRSYDVPNATEKLG